MNTNEIIVRWAVNWLCGRLSAAGIPGLDQDSMVGALTTEVIAYGVPTLILVRALYTGTKGWILARLQGHHAPALLDAAAAVPGVTRIEATPQLAKDTVSPAVVASSQAGGV